MKRFLLLTVFNVWTYVLIAQSPTINGFTVIPQNPTPADFIKIVTKVTTPNQGIVVDINKIVAGQQMTLNACYWQGMLPATQTFIDTFMIGQLQPGSYQILHKVYLSANQQWCNKTDSNSVMIYLMMPVTSGINEIRRENTLAVYPNPASERIFLPFYTGNKSVSVFSPTGALLLKKEVHGDTGLDISDLPQGLYSIIYSANDQNYIGKFMKLARE